MAERKFRPGSSLYKLHNVRDYFQSSKNGIEDRQSVPNSPFPFLPDYLPISAITRNAGEKQVIPLLSKQQREYLDSIRFAVDTLRLASPSLVTKKFDPQFDTTATMIAELLSALTRANRNLADSALTEQKYTFMEGVAVQKDIAYLYRGATDSKVTDASLDVIQPRYQMPSGKRGNIWNKYRLALIPLYTQLSNAVSQFSGEKDFWPIDDGRDTVGILESRILAMLAYLLIQKGKVITNADARLKELEDYQDIMMKELSLFLASYSKPTILSEEYKPPAKEVSIGPSATATAAATGGERKGSA